MARADAPTVGRSLVDGWRERLRLEPAGRRALGFDALLAVAVVLVEMVLTAFGPPDMRTAGWSATIGWSLAGCVALVLRRVATWTAVWVVLASLASSIVTRHQPLTMVIAILLVTYTVAAEFPLRRAAPTAALLWLPVFLLNAVTPADLRPTDMSAFYIAFLNGLMAMVCFLVGRTVHARRTSILALEERARAAEQNQRALAEQAVGDERRRIARELHDMVAHHVSVMGVLATGARRVLKRDADAADEALATIEDTSRATLREMRRLLDVLRTDAEPAAELSPQPGLAGIEALVEQVREAGLPVALRVDGTPGPLDSGVALAIFRIVQEALTNALKHAGNATAHVRLSFGVYWLIVEVFDTGRGPAPGSDQAVGHGLVGMRERVALYGGTLRTGPRPGGGFRVYAKIPMEQS
ncbi:sensor histidine kinase [Phytohabitans houttuyneae]|uniref:histidine kinase n=1 Tax=Phytohabitans houttuyneae TaxID=1076126 RepID=A0A6V8KIE2_9ACTN|nr:sensor histidine kinase [Phytohabitans houttuyneae]GFJ83190.1 two-component sensor histidine kinase [Phytohabitans houttuyneae]